MDPEAETAFQQIKSQITAAPILALPDFDELFEVTTDACKTGIGVVLSHKGRPVAYFSKKRNYSTYDVELYSVVQALKHWRHYLIHGEFLIKSDHEALKFINSQQTGQVV